MQRASCTNPAIKPNRLATPPNKIGMNAPPIIAVNLSSTIKRIAIGHEPSFRKFSFYIFQKKENYPQSKLTKSFRYRIN